MTYPSNSESFLSLTGENTSSFDQVPTAVWLHDACSPGAVVMYLALRRYLTMSKGKALPSRTSLAIDLGVKSLRSVDARINELVAAGWLLVTPRIRTDGKGQSSNLYHLLWNPIDSATDPRLVDHKRRVAEFDSWMTKRQRTNAKSGLRSTRMAEWSPEVAERRTRGGARFDSGGEQDTALRGEQDTAPLESVLLESLLLYIKTFAPSSPDSADAEPIVSDSAVSALIKALEADPAIARQVLSRWTLPFQ